MWYHLCVCEQASERTSRERLRRMTHARFTLSVCVSCEHLLSAARQTLTHSLCARRYISERELKAKRACLGTRVCVWNVGELGPTAQLGCLCLGSVMQTCHRRHASHAAQSHWRLNKWEKNAHTAHTRSFSFIRSQLVYTRVKRVHAALSEGNTHCVCAAHSFRSQIRHACCRHLKDAFGADALL